MCWRRYLLRCQSGLSNGSPLGLNCGWFPGLTNDPKVLNCLNSGEAASAGARQLEQLSELLIKLLNRCQIKGDNHHKRRGRIFLTL
jgi:hypothetical protein